MKLVGLLKNELSGGAAQNLHIHDMDYVLSQFGKPKKIKSVQNLIGEKASYINSLLIYDDFVVGVEGTWALPGTHPFEATFRVVFEKGTVENAGGKLMLYTDAAAEEIKIEKEENLGEGFEGGKVIMDYDNAEITLNDGQRFSVKTTVDPDIVYEDGKDYWGFQHLREIADFYDAVENDTEPTISGREALKIQKLICEIYKKGTENFERN